MAGIPEWPVGYLLKRLMQKTTSPAYDADTDSNEAISEAIAAVDAGQVAVSTAATIVQDAATGTPSVVTVTSSADANTFGSWAALDAAAAADLWICGFTVAPAQSTLASPATVSFCIEIGTGGTPAAIIRYSATQTVVSAVGVYNPIVITLPIPIKVASGTAISARASTGTADNMQFLVGLSYYIGL